MPNGRTGEHASNLYTVCTVSTYLWHMLTVVLHGTAGGRRTSTESERALNSNAHAQSCHHTSVATNGSSSTHTNNNNKKVRFVYEHFYSLTKYMEILLFSQLASRHQLQLEIDKVKQLIYSSVFLVLTIVMLLPFSRIWSSFVIRRPSGVFSYSVTSSSNMLTKSSKPSNVPTISLSFFIIMWILEPMHLSTNSAGKRLH